MTILKTSREIAENMAPRKRLKHKHVARKYVFDYESSDEGQPLEVRFR